MKPRSSKKDEPTIDYDTHPARNLEPRAQGYGIGGGYEKPRRRSTESAEKKNETYGPLPHSGYFGSGAGRERFKRGEAGFRDELAWYPAQYGRTTTDSEKKK
jgi:hypothetical protein